MSNEAGLPPSTRSTPSRPMELLEFIAEICAHRSGTLCTILCASSGSGYDADEIAQDCRRLRDAIVVATS